MTLLYAALLGVVQGLTEFLPVSSSAHLILARALFGWEVEVFGLAFDVACHVGTLFAVVAFFWQDLREMVAAVPRLFGNTANARRARLILVGTFPLVIAGMSLSAFIEVNLRTPGVSSLMLTIGAVGLLVAERIAPRLRDEDRLHYGDAVLVGLAQACALLPGVSRSGVTMTVGMFVGLRRAAAARFSFVLGVPAIGAAAAAQGRELAVLGLDPEAAALLAVGTVTAAGVGYLTIKYFLAYLGSHRLDVFAYYRLALAAVVVVWLFAR